MPQDTRVEPRVEPKAETKPPAAEIDELAFRLFAETAAARPQAGEREAMDSYRKAQAFLSVREKVRAGQANPSKPATTDFADCSAPNLPRTHPFNLVAQTYTDRKNGGAQYPGDLTRANRIKKWLDENPTPEDGPEELVNRLNQHFPELNWDAVTVNTARTILPAHCKN